MTVSDEKDYIMRMIKEIARVLFSVMFGKKYVAVELPEENKFQVSGKKLTDFTEMADNGKVNEAENLLLETIDYGDKSEVAAALLFYQHVGEMDDEFLAENNYSKEEALEGMKQLVKNAGYGDVSSILYSD